MNESNNNPEKAEEWNVDALS